MPLHTPPDQDIFIVGATGDLAQRKLIPALYNLHRQKLLPAKGGIIGMSSIARDITRQKQAEEAAAVSARR